MMEFSDSVSVSGGSSEVGGPSSVASVASILVVQPADVHAVTV